MRFEICVALNLTFQCHFAMPLKVKSYGALGLAIWFSNHMSAPRPLAVNRQFNIFRLPLMIGLNIRITPHTLTLGRFFWNRISVHFWVKGKAPTKSEVNWLNAFWDILLIESLTRTRAHEHCNKPRPAVVKYGSYRGGVIYILTISEPNFRGWVYKVFF